jgi:DNA-binding NtrC family response regulator
MYKRAQPVKVRESGKILIVENDQLTSSALSKVISNYFNCEVNIAASESEALSYLSARTYDLIIVGYSGSEAVSRSSIDNLKLKYPGTPMIVVLGDCSDEDQDLIKQKGIYRIIYKPLKLTSFLETVAGAFLEKEHTLTFA